MLLVLLFSFHVAVAQPWDKYGALEVSDNGRFLQHSDGTPFFWQADTAWGIFRNSLRDANEKLKQPYPIESYFSTRAMQGFNVIQAQLLPLTASKSKVVEGAFATGAEDVEVNAYGHMAFVDGNSSGDFTAPILAEQVTSAIDDYWEYVEYIIDTAGKYGMYMAIVPAWNNHFSVENPPPIVNDTVVAYDYGYFLGQRFAAKKNLIWIMGGDAHVKQKNINKNVLNKKLIVMNSAIAKGIADGRNGIKKQNCKTDYSNTLMTLHPKGGGQSSKNLKAYREAKWMDFDAIQSSITHDRLTKKVGRSTYNFVQLDYQNKPIRPSLDVEVSYEYSWRQFGLDKDADNADTIPITSWEARRSGYLAVFAGAMGVSYGHRNLIHFLRAEQTGNLGANAPWYESLGINLANKKITSGAKAGEAANHIQYLSNLILSRPNYSRVPDQSLIVNKNQGNRFNRLQATRAKDGSYALVYSSNGRDLVLDLTKLNIKHINAWWYQPKDGQVYNNEGELTADKPFMQCVKISKTSRKMEFSPPGKPSPASSTPDVTEFKNNALGNDWVLVIDDAEKNFYVPGKTTSVEHSNAISWCADS